jgi:hypothetical protein
MTSLQWKSLPATCWWPLLGPGRQGAVHLPHRRPR